ILRMTIVCNDRSLLLRSPRRPTHLPYTTLFRSEDGEAGTGANTTDVGKNGPAKAPSGREEGHRFEKVCLARAVLAGQHHVSTIRSEEHTSELQSRENLVCRLLLEKKKNNISASK